MHSHASDMTHRAHLVYLVLLLYWLVMSLGCGSNPSSKVVQSTSVEGLMMLNERMINE